MNVMDAWGPKFLHTQIQAPLIKSQEISTIGWNSDGEMKRDARDAYLTTSSPLCPLCTQSPYKSTMQWVKTAACVTGKSAPSNRELVLFSCMNDFVLSRCFPRDPHLLCFWRLLQAGPAHDHACQIHDLLTVYTSRSCSYFSREPLVCSPQMEK